MNSKWHYFTSFFMLFFISISTADTLSLDSCKQRATYQPLFYGATAVAIGAGLFSLINFMPISPEYSSERTKNGFLSLGVSASLGIVAFVSFFKYQQYNNSCNQTKEHLKPD